MIRKFISLLTLICFIGTNLPVQAQNVSSLPALDQMLSLTNSFRPTLFKGLKIYSENPFRIDFLVDNGQSFSEEELQQESTILAQYFLAALTTPSKDLWVNLSPIEKDRIIPEALGQTIMGRDLLSQDYVLKQLTASLMYPENSIGRELWDNIHRVVYEQTGSAEIPEDLLHKIWIVPERAMVQEDGAVAYVKEARMKVLLEEDFLMREQSESAFADSGLKPVSTTALGNGSIQQIIRSVLIPVIEREVNEGKNFVQLRRIFHSMVLAMWFKRKIQESVLGESYADQNKIVGVENGDTNAKWEIYEQYLEAFKSGLYDVIREDYDPVAQSIIPRRYFTGGAGFEHIDSAMVVEQAPIVLDSTLLVHQFLLDPVNTDGETFNAAMMTRPEKEAQAIKTLLSAFDELERDYKKILTDIHNFPDFGAVLDALNASDRKIHELIKRSDSYAGKKSLEGALIQNICEDYQKQMMAQHQRVRERLLIYLVYHWRGDLRKHPQHDAIQKQANNILQKWNNAPEGFPEDMKHFANIRESLTIAQSLGKERRIRAKLRHEIKRVSRNAMIKTTTPRWPVSYFLVSAYTELIMSEWSSNTDLRRILADISSYYDTDHLDRFKVQALVTYWQKRFQNDEQVIRQMDILDPLLIEKIGKDVLSVEKSRRRLEAFRQTMKWAGIVGFAALAFVVFNHVDFQNVKFKQSDETEQAETADQQNSMDTTNTTELSENQTQEILHKITDLLQNSPKIDVEQDRTEELKAVEEDLRKTEENIQSLEKQQQGFKRQQEVIQQMAQEQVQEVQVQFDSLKDTASKLDVQEAPQQDTFPMVQWYEPGKETSTSDSGAKEPSSFDNASSKENPDFKPDDEGGLHDQQADLGDGAVPYVKGFEVVGGNGYLQEGRLTIIDPLSGKGFVRKSDFQEWTITPEDVSFDQHIVRKSSDLNVYAFLSPGYVISGLRTENSSVKLKIFFDRVNSVWKIVFDRAPGIFQVGMRQAHRGELPDVKMMNMADVKGNILSRSEAEHMIQSNIPPKVWEILQEAKNFPENQKRQILEKLMYLFAASTNPLFNSSGQNMMQKMFEAYAAECEGLSTMYAVFSFVLRLPTEIQVGYRNVGGWSGHAWVMTPQGIEDPVQYVSVTSPFSQKKGVTKEQWQEEWDYLGSEERKQAIDHQLDVILLSLQQEAIQDQLQLKKDQLEELNQKKQNLESHETLFPEEQYRDLLKIYENRLQALRKVRLTPDQVQRILQTAEQMPVEAHNEIELMAQGHYILGLLTEIERQIEIDSLASRIETQDVGIHLRIADLKKDILWKILSKGKSEGWNLHEPINKAATYLEIIPGAEDPAVGLKDILTNEQFAFSQRLYSNGDKYVDRWKDLTVIETQDGLKITEEVFSRMGLNGRAVIEALDTAGFVKKSQNDDSYTTFGYISDKEARSLFGERSAEVLSVLNQAKEGQYHFVVRRAVDFKVDSGAQDVLHLPPTSIHWAEFIDLPFQGDDWLLAIWPDDNITQFYGPVADKMGITGETFDGAPKDIIGDIDGELLIVKRNASGDDDAFIGPGGDKLVFGQEQPLHDAISGQGGTLGNPIKVSDSEYVVLLERSGAFDAMSLRKRPDGKYEYDFGVKYAVFDFSWIPPFVFSDDRFAFVVQDFDGQWMYWGRLNDSELENLKVDSYEELEGLGESLDGRIIYGYRKQMEREVLKYIRGNPSLFQKLSPFGYGGFFIPTSFGEKICIIQRNENEISLIDLDVAPTDRRFVVLDMAFIDERLVDEEGFFVSDFGVGAQFGVKYGARLSTAYRIFDPAFDDYFTERIDIRAQRLLTRLRLQQYRHEYSIKFPLVDGSETFEDLQEYERLSRDFVALIEDMNTSYSARYFDRNIFLDLGRELMEAEARKHTQSIFAGFFRSGMKFKDDSYFDPLSFYDMLKPWDLGYLAYPMWQQWIEQGNINLTTRIELDDNSKLLIDEYLQKLAEVYRIKDLKISPVLYKNQAEQMRLLDQLLLDGIDAPDDQRQRVEEYRKKVIQVLDEVRALILETQVYEGPQDFAPFFEALHEIAGNERPFDVELTEESKEGGGYALVNQWRHNWPGFDVARDLSKWREVNGKLTEILGKDFHGTTQLNVPSSLLNEVGHDWLAWIVIYSILTALSHLVAAFFRRDFDLRQKSVEEIVEEIWKNNPWLEGIGLGTEEGVKDIIQRLVQAGVDPVEEQKQELEGFKKSLSEKERAIVDGILLLAFDRPDREKVDWNRLLNILVPWFGTTWIRSRPNFFQRQTMNNEIADYFKTMSPDANVESVMSDLKIIVEKSAEFKDKDMTTVERPTLLDPEVFKQALMAKFMSAPKVVVNDPGLKIRGEDGTSKPQSGYGGEFSEHRHYERGDDPRYIDWRASARTGKVMVKQFDQQAEVQAGIVIDMRSIGVMDMDQWMNEVIYSIKVMKYETRHGNGRFDYRMMGLIFLMPSGEVEVERSGFGHAHIKASTLVGEIIKKVSEKYSRGYDQVRQQQELNLKFYNQDQNRRYRERTEDILSGSKLTGERLQKAVNVSKLSRITVFMSGVNPESMPEIVQQFYPAPVFSWNQNQSQRESLDRAMINAISKDPKSVGGIHLGQDYDFEVEQNGQRMKFYFESDVLLSPDFSGFKPVFLKAVPLSDLQNSSPDRVLAKH